jgi:signal transduction histidine kinase
MTLEAQQQGQPAATLRRRMLKLAAGMLAAFLVLDAVLFLHIRHLSGELDQFFLASRQMHLLHQAAQAARMFLVSQPDPATIERLKIDLEEDIDVVPSLEPEERELVRLVDYTLEKPDQYVEALRLRISEVEDTHKAYDHKLRYLEDKYRQEARQLIILQASILLVLPVLLALTPLIMLRDVADGIARLKAKMLAGRHTGDSRQVDLERADEIGELGKAMDDTFMTLARRQSESHAARQLLSEQQKMTDIINLAAGMAHEIGNPLAVLSAALDSLEEQPEHAAISAPMREAIGRIDLLLKQFTQFSLVGGDVYDQIDVNEVAKSAFSVIGMDERLRQCRFLADLSPDIPAVQFSRPALELGLFSLLSTLGVLLHHRHGGVAVSSSAVEEGVKIQVAATRATAPDDYVDEEFVVLPIGEEHVIIRSIFRLLSSYGAELSVERFDAMERRITLFVPIFSRSLIGGERG